MESIWDSIVYAKEADGDLPKLDYLVAWKGYSEEKDTWEPFLAVMQLRKMVGNFYKDHPVITWPQSREFPKKKSCDNNHPKFHHGQFDFHCNASPSQAPTWSRGSFSSYALVRLRTRLPTHLTSHDDKEGWQEKMITSFIIHSSPYAIYFSLLHLCTSRRYQSKIVHLLRHAVCYPNGRNAWQGSWSCQLDAIDAPPLCGSQPCHRYQPK